MFLGFLGRISKHGKPATGGPWWEPWIYILHPQLNICVGKCMYLKLNEMYVGDVEDWKMLLMITSMKQIT